MASLIIAVILVGAFVWIGASLWSQLDPRNDPNLPTVSTYQPYLDDYVVYWSAGRMVLDSDAGLLYNQPAIRYVQADATGQSGWQVADLPFFNPPFIAGMLAPLALLPLKTSAVVFMAISLVALAVTLSYLMRGFSRLEAALWTVGILASMPFYYTLLHGQFSFLLLGLFTGAYVLLKRRSDAWAGILLSLLLMKPQLLILPLVILVADRRYAAIKGFVLASAALTVCSLLVAGPVGLYDYARLMLDATGWHNQDGIAIYAMFGWNSFFTNLFGNAGFTLVTLFSIGAAVGTVAMCVATWRAMPQHKDESSFDLRYAAAMFGTLLISPHLYGQDLIIAVLPALLLYRSTNDPAMRLKLGTTFAIGWFVMYKHFDLLNATGLNFVALMMFGLAFYSAWRLRVFDRFVAVVGSMCQAHLDRVSYYDEAS